MLRSCFGRWGFIFFPREFSTLEHGRRSGRSVGCSQAQSGSRVARRSPRKPSMSNHRAGYRVSKDAPDGSAVLDHNADLIMGQFPGIFSSMSRGPVTPQASQATEASIDELVRYIGRPRPSADRLGLCAGWRAHKPAYGMSGFARPMVVQERQAAMPWRDLKNALKKLTLSQMNAEIAT